ncbi:MAG: imidazolonepropionase [Bacteroidales bacterium]|nr:imidazolonepropionase [Bacteroidales bacterium]
MKRILIRNIAHLYGILPAGIERLQGKEMAHVEKIDDAWLSIEGGRIIDFGPMSSLPYTTFDEVIDAEGGTLMPCFCDPHTHLVYAGSREQEFVDKIQGLSYAEIAQRGGGILNSVDLLHRLSEEELFEQAMRRMEEIEAKGTGCIEIKSGYGLSTEDELKILRVIRQIGQSSRVKVVSTFLGAHAVSRNYRGRQGDYVRLVIDEMIPTVGREQLADYIDVFCDQGFFTPEETARILEAGARYGMRPKIHADELAPSGGVRVAVEHNALSVDHLESMPDDEIDLLLGTATMPTCLPGTSFFLNMPYAHARRMIDRGLGIALASDYNPGSTPSGDMKFVFSLGCIKLRLLPEEAFNAVTINAAYAMGLSQEYGSITRGKVAHLIITYPIPSLAFIPYAYTSPIIRQVILKNIL